METPFQAPEKVLFSLNQDKSFHSFQNISSHPFQNILSSLLSRIRGSKAVQRLNSPMVFVIDCTLNALYNQDIYQAVLGKHKNRLLSYVNPYFILSLKSKQLFSNFGRESMFHTATTKKRDSTALATHLLLKKLSNLSSVHKLRQMTRQAFINLH